jgi:putative endonuclease
LAKSHAMFHVYILSNPSRSTLYINTTDDLCDTILRHKKGKESLFTRKYKLVHMIYLESFSDGETALARQRQLKNWHRQWKWNLILAANPKLRELTCVDAEPSSASQKTHKKKLLIPEKL